LPIRASIACGTRAALLIPVSFLAIAGPPARAGDDDSDLFGREVVVTATRGSTDEAQLAVPVVVITRAEIERALAGDVAGLLQGQPGVEIARNGGPGQAASLFVRGTGSNHTTVLVDGVRVNPGTIGGAALQNIQPESIERIELVEGARSSLYGSDAIGGVLNIITRAGSARGLSAMASAGRYGAHGFAVDGGTEAGGLQVGGSLARQAAQGFAPAAGSDARGDYDNTSGNLHARYAISPALAVDANGWRATGHNAYSNFGSPANQDYTDASYAASLLYGDDAAGAGGDAAGAGLAPGHGVHGRLAVNRAQAEYRQRESADFDRTVRDAIEGQVVVPHGAQQLTAGFVAASEQARSLSYGLPYDVTTHALLVYGQDQWHGERSDLLLAAGYTHHDDFGAHLTGNVEGLRLLGRVAGGQLRASAAWGSAFHAPEATDRYGFGGNPALGPETSHQLEAGLRWEGAHAQWRISGYENRLAGLIQYVPIDPVNFVYQAQNVARARIRGLALLGEWRGGPWRVRGWGELQDPRDLSDDSTLLRRARRNLGASVGWERGRGYAQLEAQSAGPRPDFGGTSMGGYTLLSLGAGWQLGARFTAQLRLDNALDRRYELASGYNTPGRSVTLALRWHMR
jgi:vitamin B12 transporter